MSFKESQSGMVLRAGNIVVSIKDIFSILVERPVQWGHRNVITR